MNFFDNVDTQAGAFEASNDFTPIPEGTAVLAAIEQAKNDEYNNNRYINLKWRIAKPVEYQNRVIFQKVRVYDADPSKAATAKQMLAAIAVNAGGGLFNTMKQANEQTPSDNSLSTLCNRPMVLKLGVWSMEINGQVKSGNLVRAVSPAKNAAPVQQPVQQPAQQQPAPDFDDIPF